MAALRLIAERAGKVILQYYVDAEEITVRQKDDASPVTDADEAAETFILGALNTLTPHIPVVSEEAASAGEIPEIDGDFFWLVDPLDGTKEFISRNGEFTVNIALIEHGVPVAGVVHAPALAMTWTGAGEGTANFSETDNPPMKISVREIPDEGATVVASRRHGTGEKLEQFLASRKINDRVTAGSSLKFCLVASGQADLYPRFGRTMEWDTAAGHAVLLAAGGDVWTLENEPLDYGKAGFENPDFIAEGVHLDAGFESAETEG
ncbi:3'(2'),5'-bisphosphate nucleotidase CysQ [Denitrobaculum tricleocarpae]|uniref:3'(2'),5'-bisphosphate nucleotidase CysQ n=2 Tax=Denitrobaculum tricleocarpae TaxID=2591009 RepID=A0A545U3D0_9PROT|nr:3'(2'),5'-bisphosphate nucleotidase CysQ [Denitrobaculum tricleocarpae]TQV83980.1 3'(2'),5'-bisphosphate nucleotidase CysQ [Denitrobaculum tricleocarpae]